MKYTIDFFSFDKTALPLIFYLTLFTLRIKRLCISFKKHRLKICCSFVLKVFLFGHAIKSERIRKN